MQPHLTRPKLIPLKLSGPINIQQSPLITSNWRLKIEHKQTCTRTTTSSERKRDLGLVARGWVQRVNRLPLRVSWRWTESGDGVSRWQRATCNAREWPCYGLGIRRGKEFVWWCYNLIFTVVNCLFPARKASPINGRFADGFIGGFWWWHALLVP